MPTTPFHRRALREKITTPVSYLLLSLSISSLGIAFSRAQADAPAPKELTAQFEIRFLEGMIDHHAMAVHMAELCGQNAQHEELLTVCEQINTTQQHEIEQMQGWLEAWYESSHEPQMNERHERQMAQLTSLNNEEFEIEFMKQMSDHHWQAIVESSQCLIGAYHEELENLCQDIILAQAQEIQQMEDWLCEWYDLCQTPANNGSIPPSHEPPPEEPSDSSS